MTKDFVFTTKASNQIQVSAYGFSNLKTAPCVIFVHGFKGFKDWGFWPLSGRSFAEKGFFVLSFNFSHNGIGDDLISFTELDKFARNTYSLEVSELNEVIDSYRNGFFGYTDNNKMGILGHSRGGAISLIAASGRNDVQAVAVWASVANLDRYSIRQKEKWKKDGFFEVVNTRTHQVMRLNVSLLADIEANASGTLNIEKAVRNLNKPLFIAHGNQDMSVKIEEGRMIYKWSDTTRSQFYEIESTGHTFGIVHPFDGSNKKFDDLLKTTINFFQSNLSED